LRRTLSHVLAALASALLVAGCGSGDKLSSGTEQGDVLANALISLNDVDSAKFSTQLDFSAEGPNGGQGSLSLSGQSGKKKISLDGKVKIDAQRLKQDLQLGLRVSSDKFFVGLMEKWYVTDLADLREMAEAQASRASESPLDIVDRLRARAAIHDIANTAFVGQVSDGPETDGVATVRWQGTISPKGLIAIALKYGGDDLTLSANDRQQTLAVAEELAKLFKMELLVGSADGRPRQFVATFSADRSQMQKVAAAAGETLSSTDPHAIDLRLQVDLSNYDEDFTVEEPQNPSSFDELLGDAFGMTEAG
jgi:hypothetical protein